MSAPTFDLGWLLAPLRIEEFLDEVWEQRPYVIQRDDSGYYKSLFSGADLDAVLEFGRPQPAELRVVSEGKWLRSDQYFQSDGRLDLNQLRRSYIEGYTIVIHGLHRFWAPVAECVQALQRRLSYKVTPNVYLTPRGSRGLDPHYDTHDVFVLQLMGRKTWRVYGEAEAFPLLGTCSPEPIARELLPEPRVTELAAGDAMYLPRGWVHEAQTTDESSLHLTVGVYPPQWRDFMAKALMALSMNHESLRRALPVGYLDDPGVVVGLADRLREFAGLLEQEGLAAQALGMLQDEFVRNGRAVPDGEFVQALDAVPSIELHTRLVKRPHLYCRVIPVEDSIGIQFARSIVRGPEHYREAMVFVAEIDGPFMVADLPALDDEAKVALGQRLVRDGLLRFADSEPSVRC